MWRFVLLASLIPGLLQADDSALFKQVADQIANDWFDRAAIVFEFESAESSSLTLLHSENAKITFARFGSTIFCDSSRKPQIHTLRDDGYPIHTTLQSDQILFRPGKPGLSVSYDLEGEKKHILAVHIDPQEDLSRSAQRIYTYSHLLPWLGTMLPRSESAIDLIRDAKNIRTEGDRIISTSTSEFGKLEIVLMKRPTGARLERIVLDQSASDRYHYANAYRLSEVKQLWRSQIENMTQHRLTLTISPSESHERPFDAIVCQDDYTIDGKAWRSVEKHRVISYRKLSQDSDINQYRLPIPDGTKVISPNPAFKTVAMVYRNEDVVHEVDGRALEPGMAPPGRSLFYYLTYILPALACMSLLVWYITRRRAQRSQ
jgi:hypothetical protein